MFQVEEEDEQWEELDGAPKPSKPKRTCFEGVDDDRICLWFRSAGGFWLAEEPLYRLEITIL